MSAGKDGLPHRSSVDSALKLFGRTIPISVSQDLTMLKHEKSSDSREAGECRVLDLKQEEKNFKKPEKIVPCPRCESSDTKFCYFNNYNVNQPRHFCKNCHRYWTAGGTMRNVPVGAGRRRNKHFASHLPNSKTHLRSLPKSMDLPFEEASTSGSSITTASHTMNEFSKPDASEHSYLVSPRWHSPATVNISDAYVVSCKWQCEAGNDGGAAILGKHCREAKLVEEGRRETSVLAPKTLRLDDPNEASKSPIWASLGFKPYSLETKF